MDKHKKQRRLYPEIHRGDSWYDITMEDEEELKGTPIKSVVQSSIDNDTDEWQTVKNKRRKRRR